MQRGVAAAGRSDLQVLDLLRNFAKLDPDSFPDALREGAVAGLAASQNEMINAIKSGLERGGELDAQTAEALDELASKSFKVAEAKVENLLKDRDPNKQIVEAIDNLKAKVLTEYQAEESFLTALHKTFNPKSAFITEPLDKIAAILQNQKEISKTQDARKEVADLDESIRKLKSENTAVFEGAKKELKDIAEFIPETIKQGLGLLSNKQIDALEFNPKSRDILMEQQKIIQDKLLGGRTGSAGVREPFPEQVALMDRIHLKQKLLLEMF